MVQESGEAHMTDAPKKIWAWSDFAQCLAGTWGVTRYPSYAHEYILAAEHERLVAERDAEIARLREALLAQIAWLEECTGEGLEGKDVALVAEIAATLGDDNG